MHWKSCVIDHVIEKLEWSKGRGRMIESKEISDEVESNSKWSNRWYNNIHQSLPIRLCNPTN